MCHIRKYNPTYLNHQGLKPIMHFEGYAVYYFKIRYWWSDFSGEIVDKTNVYVYGRRNCVSIDEIKEFLDAHLDGLIDEDLIERGLKKPFVSKNYLEFNSFSYANPRRDISDEPSVKAIKHKTKSSRIDPTYSTPYHGEMPRNVIGMRAVSSDGRLITIEPREDYGLRDRN